ncbi:S1 RNA-binding domain-containing protein [Coleofasciculus sp. FACHB-64]|uniref:S1 RNA-binding domain-containing protein n=1 Tax=Cyanophyceae TaxID=3028117 RepID=UPI001684E4A7|nr:MULTISPECIES: S1 RNA-binding domain-containing protein [unclassified Coleofasciculus]MBD1899677.1 S1 RNA-binding domain-containing protein [Coleofasciculus sp. FACHB-125]MBD2045411.1 S1 RNA-binding domain-containing protein [Coleofasciculus sp. FACHB-64]
MNSNLSSFRPGDVVIGKAIALEPEGALIDIGAPTAIFLPIREMSINEIDSPEEALQLNESREFLIVNQYDEAGNLILGLSIRQLEKKLAWERVRQMQAENVTVYAIIFETHRFGVSVKVEGLRGCVLHSRLDTRKPKEELMGEEIPIKIVEVDEDRDRLFVSHRLALYPAGIKHLEVGQVVTGRVLALKPYGAFINIAVINALLHISEISHADFDKPESIFKVDDEIKAMIISMDAEKDRVSLSTKALEPELGDMLKNPQKVYEKAEEMAAKYRNQMQK